MSHNVDSDQINTTENISYVIEYEIEKFKKNYIYLLEFSNSLFKSSRLQKLFGEGKIEI